MQVQKSDDQELVLLEKQEVWAKIILSLFELPDGFKPRAYMFTDSNRTRQNKFRMVVNKAEQTILILGDSLPSHRGAKVFYKEGVVSVYFNNRDHFFVNDLLRFLETVSASIAV